MTALALDRASVRTFDKAGHLHVEIANISKANVCPYLGSEIPDAAALGLDANRTYNLLRDPDEMAKAAASFSGKPVVLNHRPQVATDHDRAITIGAVGDATFDPPYLRAPLSIWDGEAIRLIESGAQQELSCGYFYRADMTPGIYQGEAYDGRMVDIAGNHVALVSEGRAGPDVVIGDTMETINMLKSRMALVASGALVAHLAPRLAADAKMPDINAILAGVNAANWKAQKPTIRMALDTACAGRLAKDATLDEVVDMLDKLDDITDDAEVAGDEVEETEEEKAARLAKEAAAMKGADKEDEPDMKPEAKAAMDAAIGAAVAKAVSATEGAVVARMNALREAERVVRPYVGEIAVAMDSAEAVYRFALGKVGVDTKDLHSSALKPVLLAQPVPGAAKPRAAVAMDAAGAKALEVTYPNFNRLRHV